jgi:hypothetical protein
MLNKIERETTRLPLLYSGSMDYCCMFFVLHTNENTQRGVQRTRGKTWEVREVQGRVLDVQIGSRISSKDMRILNGASEEVPATGAPYNHFLTLSSCWDCYSFCSAPGRLTDLSSTASCTGIRTGQLLVISHMCIVRGLPENDCEGEARSAAG